MDSKQTAKKGREEQGTENWKRKRENNNASKNDSSQPRPPKKRRQTAHELTQDSSADFSKASDSIMTSTADPASTSTSSSDLTATYDVTSINVLSSTHIQKKVTQTLALLSEYPAVGKPKVVLLHAKAPVASKLITIVEITKREIAKSGGKWFQYNKIEEIMVEQKEVPKKDKGKDEEGNAAGDEDEQDEEEAMAFETMKTPFERAIEGKPKVRGVPVMTLYLSRFRIDSLRRAFGYVQMITYVNMVARGLWLTHVP
jgi:hypothetical protein